jgi:hypothetical protein
MDTALPFLTVEELAQRRGVPRWPVVLDAWSRQAHREVHDWSPKVMR